MSALKRWLPRNELRVIAFLAIILVSFLIFAKLLLELSGRGWLKDTLVDEFSLLLLFGAALLLWLTQARLDRASAQLEWHERIKDELSIVRNYADLLTVISHAQPPEAPITGLVLLLPNRTAREYVPVAEWTPSGEAFRSSVEGGLDFVPAEPAVNRVVACLSRANGAGESRQRYYCLSLGLGARQVARLILALPEASRPPAELIGLLNSLALDIALVVDRLEQITRPRPADLELQKTMARYLHDTVGHELAYLRMKLEALAYDPHLRQQDQLRSEVERLQVVANRSYEQVRTVLSDLEASELPDLAAAINECGACIAERNQLDFQFESSGPAQILPLQVHRKVLLTVREVLHNIEKHAQAKSVRVSFAWLPDHLMILVTDDGRGFDSVSAAELKDHYGLKIIAETMREIGGLHSLESVPEGGTCVKLVLPYRQN
jgi:signal transduction histidine kinase